MNKEFSDGFMQDLAYLLKVCLEKGTDCLELEFDFNGTRLNVEIAFSIGK